MTTTSVSGTWPDPRWHGRVCSADSAAWIVFERDAESTKRAGPSRCIGGLAIENPVGGVMTFKATASDTAGALTAIETIAAPGEGPPLHVHVEDEVIYTLEGSFRVRLGDTIQQADPGSFVFIPAGTPHTWQNVGEKPARFFATITPAATAFEEFFQHYAELPGGERGADAFSRIAAETRAFEVLGPPLAVSDPL